MGLAAFLEEQLHPERLADAEVAQRMAALPALQLTSAERVQAITAFQKAQRARREQEAAGEESLEPVAPAQATEAQRDEARAARRGARKELGKVGRGPGFDYTAQLAEARLLRAVGSERQLQEVMVDFWFNHFNVFAGKDREAALLPEYEEQVIRAHALGSFPELLAATARSPAMLIYLDNWRSEAAPAQAAPPPRRGRAPPAPPKRAGQGLNENYARELLELHTLGVDGGYTQADVTEVARCFTGWSVSDPGSDPRFTFKAGLHDRGMKHVLGHLIPEGGGLRDGARVLELLAAHPSTARFLARKLARRFVADDPPDAVVERVARAYAQTGGDIRSMLRALFTAPETWSRRALKAKLRSPLELVAGAARALDAEVREPLALARAVARIGAPLYAAVPPTGYGDTEATWASSGAILARIDFGLALAKGDLPGVTTPLAPLAAGARDHQEVLDRAARALGAGELSERTRSFTLARLRELPLDRQPVLVAQRAVGLLLGAPELQRR